MTDPLLILGASARAAAESARRAGFQPRAADLFADVDLRRIADATRVDDYPYGFRDVASSGPPGPWMYTGGLENHPELLRELERIRPLWGNPADVARAVRDPRRLQRALSERDLRFPEWSFRRPDDPRDWLVKPIRSCGGTDVRWAVDGPPRRRSPGRCYFQRFVDGLPAAALLAAARGRAVLLGVTRQLVGDDELLRDRDSSRLDGGSRRGRLPFRYQGSVGPIAPREVETIRRIGDCLARRFGLRGLFGVDLVIGDHDVWVIEVNPRYVASAEVIEWSSALPTLRVHADACVEGRLPEGPAIVEDKVCAKTILWAPRDWTVSDRFVDLVERTNRAPTGSGDDGSGVRRIADIPAVGTRIRADRPVCTTLVLADSMAAAIDATRSLRASLSRSIGG